MVEGERDCWRVPCAATCAVCGQLHPGLGFGVWGLGFGVWGLGFGEFVCALALLVARAIFVVLMYLCARVVCARCLRTYKNARACVCVCVCVYGIIYIYDNIYYIYRCLT
jgi:hypothetical protein